MRYLLRFGIRDWLWAIMGIALTLGWWVDIDDISPSWSNGGRDGTASAWIRRDAQDDWASFWVARQIDRQNAQGILNALDSESRNSAIRSLLALWET